MTAPGGDESIEIRATLRDEMSRPAERIADAEEHIGEAAAAASPEVALLEHRIKELGDELKKNNRAVDANTTALERNAKQHEDTKKKTKEHETALGAFHKRLDKLSKSRFDISQVVKAYKIPAMVQLLTLGATAISAIGAAGVAGLAGLAPLGGALIAYPGYALAAAQASTVLKFGMTGLADSIKLLSDPKADPKAVNEALKALSPTARILARDVAALNKGPLKNMKLATQEAMAPGLLRGFRDAVGLLPVLQRGFVGTGRVIGNVATQAGLLAKTPAFRKDLASILTTNNKVLGNFGTTGIHLVNTLRDLLVVGGPFLVWLSNVIREGAESVAQFTALGRSTGKLGAFFERTRFIMSGVGDVLFNVGQGLYFILKNSMPLANIMGRGIQGLAEDFNAWAQSVEGQNAIRKFFTDAIPVVVELAKLVKDVLVGLGSLANNQALAPIISQIRTELLPAIITLSQGVTSAFGPALVDAATAFVKFNNALTFSPLATVLEIAAKAVIAMSDAVAAAPFPLNTMLASILTLSLGLKGLNFVGAKTGLFGFVKTLSSAGTAGTGKGIGGFINGLRGAGKESTTFAGRMGMLARAGIGKLFSAIATGVTILAGAFKALTIAIISNPLIWIPLAIAAVVIAVIILYKKVEWFRNAVDAVGRTLLSWLKAVGSFFQTVWGYITGLGSTIVAAWNGVYIAVSGAFASMWNTISGFFRAVAAIVSTIAYIWSIPWRIAIVLVMLLFTALGTAAKYVFQTVIAPVINWLLNNVIRPFIAYASAAWTAMWGTIKAAVSGAVIFIGGLIAQLRSNLSAAWNAIKIAGMVIWAPIKSRVDTMVNGVKAVVGAMRAYLTGQWNTIKGNATAAWNGIASVVNNVVGKIRAAWSGLSSFLSGIWGGVSGAVSAAMSGIAGTINSVISKVNSVIGAFNHLPGPDIGQIPLLYAGGPVTMGMQAIYGEIGPEIFVPSAGLPRIIGADGPEYGKFSQSGEVLPNSVLAAATHDTDSRTPTAILAAIKNMSTGAADVEIERATISHGELPEDVYEARNEGGGGSGDIHAHFYGDINGIDDLEKAIEKIERRRKERR